MRILAIDIGGLTQDIILFDTSRNTENCVKMIMPSPTYRLAERIRGATSAGRPVFFTGVNMGGGPSKRALRSHLNKGLKAYATPSAARTFDDQPEEVAAWGVNLIADEEAPGEAARIETRDLELDSIGQALEAFGVESQWDALAVAVLDHGAAPPGVSDRVFRFRHLEETVRRSRRLTDFAYMADEIPDHLTRMRAVVESHGGETTLLVMDTPVAAAIGAAEDRRVARAAHRVVVNTGNFHTLAFHLREETIMGFFEHHTRLLTAEKLDGLIRDLVSGRLTGEAIFADDGHGCLVMESSPDMPFVTVVGPRRRMMASSGLAPYFAVPHGDMMLTGCFGLIRALSLKMEAWREEIERALEP